MAGRYKSNLARALAAVSRAIRAVSPSTLYRPTLFALAEPYFEVIRGGEPVAAVRAVDADGGEAHKFADAAVEEVVPGSGGRVCLTLAVDPSLNSAGVTLAALPLAKYYSYGLHGPVRAVIFCGLERAARLSTDVKLLEEASARAAKLSPRQAWAELQRALRRIGVEWEADPPVTIASEVIVEEWGHRILAVSLAPAQAWEAERLVRYYPIHRRLYMRKTVHHSGRVTTVITSYTVYWALQSVALYYMPGWAAKYPSTGLLVKVVEGAAKPPITPLRVKAPPGVAVHRLRGSLGLETPEHGSTYVVTTVPGMGEAALFHYVSKAFYTKGGEPRDTLSQITLTLPGGLRVGVSPVSAVIVKRINWKWAPPALERYRGRADYLAVYIPLVFVWPYTPRTAYPWSLRRVYGRYYAQGQG